MKKYVLFCMAALLTASMFGCSSQEPGVESNLPATKRATLLVEKTVSPNQAYVDSDADVVYYTVAVYQTMDHTIVVHADSNTAFFDETQYVLDYDKELSNADVSVDWTTMMGNPEPTEEDQLAIARVSILENGEIISQRNINFFKKGIETIIDTIPENQ